MPKQKDGAIAPNDKVFFGWSQDLSYKVANEMHDLFSKIFPRSEFGERMFISKQDIPPGKQWYQLVVENLQKSSLGIFFVTMENRANQWLNFEAGAIAGHQGEDRVCIVLADELDADDVLEPLKYYQVTHVRVKEHVVKLAETVHKILAPGSLDFWIKDRVEKYWDEYLAKVDLLIRGARLASPVAARVPPEETMGAIKNMAEKILDRLETLIAASNLRQTKLEPMSNSSGVSGEKSPNAAKLDEATQAWLRKINPEDGDGTESE